MYLSQISKTSKGGTGLGNQPKLATRLAAEDFSLLVGSFLLGEQMRIFKSGRYFP